MKKFSITLILMCLILFTLCLSGCSDSEKAKVDSNIKTVEELNQPVRIQVILGCGETYEFSGIRKGMVFNCDDGYEIHTSTTNSSTIRIYNDGELVFVSSNATVLLPDRMP